MKKSLRKIDKNDWEMLFTWRNHPVIRRTSFDKKELLLADHKHWFNNILKNDFVVAYILEVDTIPVGTIRFEIESGKAAKINYLIDPSQHGKGFGTKILELGVMKFFQDNREIKKVYGCVLKDNLASIRIFEKLSFKNVFEDTIEFKFEKYIG